MKAVLVITKRELQAAFDSAAAWVVIAALPAITALFFFVSGPFFDQGVASMRAGLAGQQLLDFGRDCAGALLELIVSEAAHRMRDIGDLVARHPAHLGDRLDRRAEGLGADNRRGDPPPLHLDAVVHTAR